MSGNEPRFDRSTAFAYYAALDEPQRTFAAVAERFGAVRPRRRSSARAPGRSSGRSG
jgi:hypothetical protein